MNTQAHTNRSDNPAQAIDTQPHDDPNGRGAEGGRRGRDCHGYWSLPWRRSGSQHRRSPCWTAARLRRRPFTRQTPTHASRDSSKPAMGRETMNMPAGVPVSIVWMYANQSQSGLYTTVYTNRCGYTYVNVPAGYYWGVWVDYSTRFQTSFGWKSWRYRGGSNWQWVTANNWNYGTFYLQRSVGG